MSFSTYTGPYKPLTAWPGSSVVMARPVVNRASLMPGQLPVAETPLFTYALSSAPAIEIAQNGQVAPKLAVSPAGVQYFPQWTVVAKPFEVPASTTESARNAAISSKPKSAETTVADDQKPQAEASENTAEEESLFRYSPFAQKCLDAQRNKALTDAEKLAKAEKETLQFIQAYLGDTQALLKGVEALGVTVMRADDYPWVGQFLKAIGNNNLMVQAAVYTPDTLNFPDHAEDMVDDDEYTPALRRIPEYLTYDRKTEKEGRVTLFIGPGVDKDPSLMYHEIFHIYQKLNGVHQPIEPFSLNTYQTAYDAISAKGFVAGLYFGTVVKPLLWGLRKVGLLKPQSGSIGEALRLSAETELEATRFIKTNAKTLRLSRTARQENWLYQLFNQAIRDYSWQYEAKERFGRWWIF